MNQFRACLINVIESQEIPLRASPRRGARPMPNDDAEDFLDALGEAAREWVEQQDRKEPNWRNEPFARFDASSGIVIKEKVVHLASGPEDEKEVPFTNGYFIFRRRKTKCPALTPKFITKSKKKVTCKRCLLVMGYEKKDKEARKRAVRSTRELNALFAEHGLEPLSFQ